MTDNKLWLTDEDIWGKEPSLEEQSLIDENNKLKKRIIDTDDNLENAEYTIKKIQEIIDKAIEDNIRKTNKTPSVPVVKSYRESLLVLRAIEKELKDYYSYKGD